MQASGISESNREAGSSSPGGWSLFRVVCLSGWLSSKEEEEGRMPIVQLISEGTMDAIFTSPK